MTVRLSDHLDLIVGAPGGIQKLRGLILELAVRGKLVAQDPNDEPASELLKRIAKERARLEAEGAGRKSKATPVVGVDDQPFALPLSWAWTRLGEITNFGQTDKDGEIRDTTWVLDLEDIQKDTSVLLRKVRFSERQAKSDKNRFQEGDVLYGKLRPYLNKVIVADEEGVCTTEILPVRGYYGVFPRYLMHAVKRPDFLAYVNSKSYGMKMPRLGTDDGRLALFPLPPEKEQHRIVAKVDELMAFCDRLEAEQADAGAAHARLVDTLLGTLIQSTDAADLATNWQRLAEHFDTLFTTESSLDALKQTILQLAVMGKLVPQDPNDEPASELLKRIAQERTRLEAEGKIKKSKPLPVVCDERAFSIPTTWNWIRLGALTELITKGSSPKWQGVEYVNSDEGVLFITSENVGNYVLRKLDALKFVDPRFNEIEPRSILRSGDILINLVGASIGRTARFDLTMVANINQAVALVRLINGENLDSNYLLHFLNSDFAINHMLASQVVNAQPNISLTDVRDFPVPFPPLSEQHRIVAKVDELLALCDRLKAGLADSRARQECLAATLIESALQAA